MGEEVPSFTSAAEALTHNRDTLASITTYLSIPDAISLLEATGVGDVSLSTPLTFALNNLSSTDLALFVRKRARQLRRVESADLTAASIVSCNSGALRAVACLPKLCSLNLSGLSLSSASLRALEGLPGLAYLDVSGCTYVASGADPFAHSGRNSVAFASSLIRLTADGTSLIPRRWPISIFENLKSFRGKFLEPSQINDLSQCKHLRTLTLVGTRLCTLRIFGAAWRSVMGGLHELKLIECDLLPRPHLLQPPWEVLREAVFLAKGLTSLSLVDTQEAAALAFLDGDLLRHVFPSVRSKGLRELEVVPSFALGDEGLRVISSYCGSTLSALRLGPSNPHVTDAGVSALAASCPRLTVLELPFASAVSDAGVLALAASACGVMLTRITLTRVGIMSDAPLRALAAHCPALKLLRIYGCHAAVLTTTTADDGAADADATLLARHTQQQQQSQQSVDVAHMRCSTAAVSHSSSSSGGDGYSPAITSMSDIESLRGLLARGVRVEYIPHPSAQRSVHGCTDSIRSTDSISDSAAVNSSSAAAVETPSLSSVLCSACGASIKRENVEDHRDVCPQAPTSCPNAQYGCTEIDVSRSELSVHMAVCPAWHVVCPFNKETDVHTVSRREYEEHVCAHLALMERHASVIRCPLADDGCDFVAVPAAHITATASEASARQQHLLLPQAPHLAASSVASYYPSSTASQAVSVARSGLVETIARVNAAIPNAPVEAVGPVEEGHVDDDAPQLHSDGSSSPVSRTGDANATSTQVAVAVDMNSGSSSSSCAMSHAEATGPTSSASSPSSHAAAPSSLHRDGSALLAQHRPQGSCATATAATRRGNNAPIVLTAAFLRAAAAANAALKHAAAAACDDDETPGQLQLAHGCTEHGSGDAAARDGQLQLACARGSGHLCTRLQQCSAHHRPYDKIVSSSPSALLLSRLRIDSDVAASAHLTDGSCAIATFVCLSCGVDTGHVQRTTCGTDACAAIALVRCRLGLPPAPPPRALLRHIPMATLARFGFIAPLQVEVGVIAPPSPPPLARPVVEVNPCKLKLVRPVSALATMLQLPPGFTAVPNGHSQLQQQQQQGSFSLAAATGDDADTHVASTTTASTDAAPSTTSYLPISTREPHESASASPSFAPQLPTNAASIADSGNFNLDSRCGADSGDVDFTRSFGAAGTGIVPPSSITAAGTCSTTSASSASTSTATDNNASGTTPAHHIVSTAIDTNTSGTTAAHHIFDAKRSDLALLGHNGVSSRSVAAAVLCVNNHKYRPARAAPPPPPPPLLPVINSSEVITGRVEKADSTASASSPSSPHATPPRVEDGSSSRVSQVEVGPASASLPSPLSRTSSVGGAWQVEVGQLARTLSMGGAMKSPRRPPPPPPPPPSLSASLSPTTTAAQWPISPPPPPPPELLKLNLEGPSTSASQQSITTTTTPLSTRRPPPPPPLPLATDSKLKFVPPPPPIVPPEQSQQSILSSSTTKIVSPMQLESTATSSATEMLESHATTTSTSSIGGRQPWAEVVAPILAVSQHTMRVNSDLDGSLPDYSHLSAVAAVPIAAVAVAPYAEAMVTAVLAGVTSAAAALPLGATTSILPLIDSTVGECSATSHPQLQQQHMPPFQGHHQNVLSQMRDPHHHDDVLSQLRRLHQAHGPHPPPIHDHQHQQQQQRRASETSVAATSGHSALSSASAATHGGAISISVEAAAAAVSTAASVVVVTAASVAAGVVAAEAQHHDDTASSLVSHAPLHQHHHQIPHSRDTHYQQQHQQQPSVSNSRSASVRPASAMQRRTQRAPSSSTASSSPSPPLSSASSSLFSVSNGLSTAQPPSSALSSMPTTGLSTAPSITLKGAAIPRNNPMHNARAAAAIAAARERASGGRRCKGASAGIAAVQAQLCAAVQQQQQQQQQHVDDSSSGSDVECDSGASSSAPASPVSSQVAIGPTWAGEGHGSGTQVEVGHASSRGGGYFNFGEARSEGRFALSDGDCCNGSGDCSRRSSVATLSPSTCTPRTGGGTSTIDGGGADDRGGLSCGGHRTQVEVGDGEHQRPSSTWSDPGAAPVVAAARQQQQQQQQQRDRVFLSQHSSSSPSALCAVDAGSICSTSSTTLYPMLPQLSDVLLRLNSLNNMQQELYLRGGENSADGPQLGMGGGAAPTHVRAGQPLLQLGTAGGMGEQLQLVDGAESPREEAQLLMRARASNGATGPRRGWRRPSAS